jgi:hypothetical protein
VNPFIPVSGTLCPIHVRLWAVCTPSAPVSETVCALSPPFQEQLPGSQQAHSGVWPEANANPSAVGASKKAGVGLVEGRADMEGEWGPSVWGHAIKAFPIHTVSSSQGDVGKPSPPRDRNMSWTGCQQERLYAQGGRKVPDPSTVAAIS